MFLRKTLRLCLARVFFRDAMNRRLYGRKRLQNKRHCS